MHALNVTVFNQDICKYAMRYTREVYDSMFCTFTKIGEGSCHVSLFISVTIFNKYKACKFIVSIAIELTYPNIFQI